MAIALSVLSYVAEKIGSHIFESFAEEFSQEIPSIENKLAVIQAELENQKIAHFKTALKFFKLGEVSKARDFLIHSESLDERNCVAKLLLGYLFYVEGKEKLAHDKLIEVLEINPYLITSLPGWQKFIENTRLPEIATNSWNHTLNSEHFYKNLPEPETFFKSLMWVKGTSGGALYKISCGLDAMAIAWCRSGNFLDYDTRNASEYFLTLLDLGGGQHLWTKLITDSNLVFITSKYVIIRNRISDSFQSFLTRTGKQQIEMSRSYFETIFCPRLDDVLKSQEYTRANTFLYSSAYMERLKNQREDKYLKGKSLLQKIFVKNIDFKYTDTRSIDNIFGNESISIKLINNWKKDYRVENNGNPEFFSTRIVEMLNCSAIIKRMK